MDCSMLAAGLVKYKLNEKNNEKIINCFAVQSFEADYKNNGSQYNISAAIKNAGKKGGHKKDKKDFLEPQYNDKRRVLKKKAQKEKNLPRNKAPRRD